MKQHPNNMNYADSAARAPQFLGTLVGTIAIPVWSLFAVLAVWAEDIPPFQLLAGGFGSAFLAFVLVRLTRRRSLPGMFKVSPRLILLGLFGVFGLNFFYILAIRFALPEEANIIANVWPILTIGVLLVIGQTRPHRWHFVGIAFGFLGIIILVQPSDTSGSLLGYSLALLSGISWASYSGLRTVWTEGPSDAMGAFCGLATIIAIGCHLLFETTVSLSLFQLIIVVAIGFGPMGLANVCWDYGVSRGDARSLAMLVYFIPLISTTLLIFLHDAQLTTNLVIGAVFIVGGALVGNLPSL